MFTIGKIAAGVLTACAIVAGIVLFAPPERLAKFEAWAGVVANDVENRIDEVLGKEEVIRQQALNALSDANADIERLQELAVTSRVDAELLGEKLTDLYALEAQSKERLNRLAQLIEAGEAVTLDGVIWQPTDLESYAETKITEHAAIQARIQTYTESRRLLEETAARAERALRMARQNVANLQASLELLDAKLALLAALEAEPAAFAAQGVTADTVLNDAEEIISSLTDEVEREIRLAQERNAVRQQTTVDLDEPLPELKTDDLVERLFTLAEEE
ncbi:MAG: hypothetical protein H6642_15210 [Caldilineaceae bacterium]|nr:hypothetical protein [Caldilineaceae bacterium]